jgi:hypothetical protein
VSDVVLEMLKRISRRHELLTKRPGSQPVYEPGYLWEDVLSSTLSRRMVTAPHERLMTAVELERDGVFGTPDRLLYDATGDRWVVEESKCTWMSSRGLDEDPKALFDNVKFSYWFCQVKTYAAMLDGWYAAVGDMPLRPGIPGLLPPAAPPLIRVRSLHLNGPYGWNKDFPKPLGWEIEHTHEELTTWWASIQRFEANRAQEPPDVRPDAAADQRPDPTRN